MGRGGQAKRSLGSLKGLEPGGPRYPTSGDAAHLLHARRLCLGWVPMNRTDHRDVMKGYAERIKQIKELAGAKDTMSDETAALIMIFDHLRDSDERVLKKFSGIEGELNTIREVLKLKK
jgi:hypothetical protein